MKNRKILWLMLWLFSLILVSFRGGAASYGFFFFCTAVPFLCLLYILAVILEFGIYQELESRVMTAGEPFGYTFTLQNEGWLTISGIKVVMYSDFSTVEDLPEGITFELLPGESFRFNTRMVVKYRGQIRVGVQKLLITDFLKMFTVTYKVKEPIDAIVNPRIPSEDERSWDEDFTRAFRQENKSRQDVPDFSVREYVPGDSPRRIHWKASAAGGKLLSREMTGEQQESIVVLLDAGRYSTLEKEYLPVENRVLEITLSLVQHYCLKNQPVEIGYLRRINGSMQPEYTTVGSLPGFMEFYDQLKEISFEKAMPANELELLKIDSRIDNYGSRVFLVWQKIGENDYQTFEETGRSRETMLVHVYGVSASQKEQEGLPFEGFTVLKEEVEL